MLPALRSRHRPSCSRWRTAGCRRSARPRGNGSSVGPLSSSVCSVSCRKGTAATWPADEGWIKRSSGNGCVCRNSGAGIHARTVQDRMSFHGRFHAFGYERGRSRQRGKIVPERPCPLPFFSQSRLAWTSSTTNDDIARKFVDARVCNDI